MFLALVKIEHHTFPAVLRTPMDELLLALARLMPHINPAFTIPDSLLVDLCTVLPFHSHSMLRLITRKILPLLRDATMDKRQFSEMRAEVETEYNRLVTVEKKEFVFSETLKSLIFDAVRIESDIILIENMLTASDPENKKPITAFLTPMTRKTIYKCILEQGFNVPNMITECAPNGARLSHEYGLVRKKHDRVLIQKLGIAKELKRKEPVGEATTAPAQELPATVETVMDSANEHMISPEVLKEINAAMFAPTAEQDADIKKAEMLQQQ